MSIAAVEPKPSSRLARGYLICVTATVFWSFTGIFIRYLIETYHLPPLVLAFWRDAFVALALGLAFALFKPPRLRFERRHLGFLIFYGIELSLFNSLWTISVALNGAAVSTVLAYSSAAFTAILGRLLLSERLGPVKIAAVTLSLLGCVFVSGAYDPNVWRLNLLGVVTGLVSGIAFAGYSLLGKTAAKRAIDPWTTLMYAFGFAVPFIFVYDLMHAWLPAGVASTQLFWLGGVLTGWGVLVLLAIGPTIGGFGLYMVSLNYLPVSVANLIATLEPMLTAILAFILLNERFTSPQWLGSGLIIAGVVLLRLREET